MQVHLRIPIVSILFRPYPLYSLLHPSRIPTGSRPRIGTSTVKMVTESSSSKRPMCPKCSKPTRICLCTRLKTPCLENSVVVTILQHSLEIKHPLNSTRIASLGLRNLSVVSVSDVNFQAHFVVRLLDLDQKMGSTQLEEKQSSDFGAYGNSKRNWNSFDGSASSSGLVESSDCEKISECPKGKNKLVFVNSDEAFIERGDFYGATCKEFCNGDLVIVQKSLDGNYIEDSPKCCTSGEAFPDYKNEALITKNILGRFLGPEGAAPGNVEGCVIAFTVEKYGAISSFSNYGIPKDQFQKQDNADSLLASVVAVNGLGKGLGVSKFQRKRLDGKVVHEEFEFKINVPPGSVLLFPSEKSMGIETIDFKVTNVIVLDGTWAKAKRMYNENPWLKLLPHLRLDLADVSLYGEVRRQPKAGFLSTIESIVYALKALGEDSEKLDSLLEIFKSMVGDQRRCKDERLSKVLVPSEYKKLHLYEARYLALLEESLFKNESLFVHFVLDPISVNEKFTEASFAARYACLVFIEKVKRLDVGALVFIRGIGRVKIVQFAQEEPFVRGSVMPIKDHVQLDTKELNSKVLELKEALHNLNSLEIKLKASEESLLQTQTANSLKWSENPLAVNCDEAFVPSLAERVSFAAFQPVSGSMHSEWLNLQQERLRAMETRDTLERLGSSVDFVKNNISAVAAKLALQSLKMN